MVLLVLAAWALRLVSVSGSRFHPDEALYGYWGLLIANGRDPWLTSVPVYKPPLLPYLVAVMQALFGNHDLSVRLPGLAAGLLTVSLVAVLSRSLYRNRWAAVVAAIGVALSPLCILFSSTAYIDPLMVMFGLGACVAAARGRLGWAGLLAGLAFAAKQTALVWVPLVLVLGFAARAPIPGFRPLARFAAGFALCAGLVCVWDAVRVLQGAESFWRVGAAAYGGLRFIWPHELWVRLRGWIVMAHYLFVSPIVNGVLWAGLPALMWPIVARRHRTRKVLVDLFLVSFVLIYSLLHWLFAFPIWDRYLLPLVPVLAILLGRILGFAFSCVRGRSSLAVRRLLFAACCLLLVVCLASPAVSAAHSRYPVGSSNEACDGLSQAVAFLYDLPEGAVVYQHWLGWQFAYYLFDGPAYLAYWPTPAWLAQDVKAFGATGPRYITFPSWESSARVERALAGVGYGLKPVLTATRGDGGPSFVVYHIQPLSDP